MPVVTKISPQKNKRRINIYLDGKFGFGIDLENYVKLGIKVEQNYSEEQIVEIVRKAEFQKTYDKLLRFTSLRPRSTKEINIWFYKHKVPDSLHKDLFTRLEKLELTGDKRFAAWWVDQRIQFRPKSKKALEVELRQKGIKSEVVREVLDELGINERKSALRLLSKKIHVWDKLDEFTARRKKSEYLLRNGFSWNIIKEVL